MLILSSRPGPHGGVIYDLRRTGPEWGSNHTTVTYDVQGDPRWFADALGCHEAEYFDFRLCNGRVMTIPNRMEFTGAVRSVNRVLTAQGKKAIPITYYDAGEKSQNVWRYLERFTKDFALPVASRGNHFIHDISFHTGAIFIPEDFLTYAARRIAYANGFAADLVAAGENTLAYNWRLQMVEQLDVATSAQNLYLIAHGRNPEVEDLLLNTMRIFFLGNPRMPAGLSAHEQIEQWLVQEGADSKGLKGRLVRYATERDSQFDPHADPTLIRESDPQVIKGLILKRREEIRSAVHVLQLSGSY